jgi:lipopolysaccharide transport system ATP-binding protein
MTDIVISAENIGKCYRVYDSSRSRLMNAFLPGRGRGLEELWALRDVSFVIRKGESVALIGRNGGGKSTLLEILTGTLTPTTGSVSVHGRVCALLELGSGFNPEYTGRENVILNGLLLGLTKAEIVSRLGEIEAFAEIGSAIDRPVKTYSSGMMVRLAFAVQVLSDPDILIIDEALSVGDFFFQQKCMSYIRGLKERGVTLLFVSHDMGAVRDVCERGIVLDRGKVAFDGENLDAIQYYLTGQAKTSFNEMASGAVSQNVNTPDVGTKQQPVWENSGAVNEAPTAAIVRLDILNSDGQPTLVFKMDDGIAIETTFVVHDRLPVDLTVAVKNNHGHLVMAFGTFNARTPFPSVAAGQHLKSTVRFNAALEAGDYSFNVSLARAADEGGAGAILAETPWLGPITIRWPYAEERPRFYGMFGPAYVAELEAINEAKGS